MKKIVFFDIDGTLVTRNNHVPKSTIEAVVQLKLNGITPVIATGRAPVLIKDVAKQLGITSYISMNGQYIVHENEVIYANPIDIDLVDQVVQSAIAEGDGILLSTDDEIIANSVLSLVNRGTLYTFFKQLVRVIPERVKLRLWKRMMSNAPEKKDYINKEVYMLNINANREEGKVYEDQFSDVLNFTRANDISMDIVNKGVSKATGVERMIERLGIERENTYAFGDGLNDLEMLQYVGTGVAMANGYDELKAVADYVTDSVFSHGISKGLEHLELI